MLYSRTPLVIYLTLTKHLSWSSADEPPFETVCEISQARRCQGRTITCSSSYTEDLNTAHWNSAYKDSDRCHETLFFFSGTVAQYFLLQSFHSVFNYMFLLYSELTQRLHDFISLKCFYCKYIKVVPRPKPLANNFNYTPKKLILQPLLY